MTIGSYSKIGALLRALGECMVGNLLLGEGTG